MMRPHAPRPAPRPARAFTLIELLVSMSVLTIIVLMISQLFSSATNVTVSNRKRLDADSQARLVFDHMALDFGKMLKRTDVDYQFAKVTGAQGTQAQNDAMFFFSEAPAFFDDVSTSSAGGGSSTPGPKSSLALVGYRINKAYQLERLGKQLSWDGSSASTTGGIMCLSPSPAPSPSTPDPNVIDLQSTLVGHWPDVIGTTATPAYTDGRDDADYQILAEQVCRLEFCFQLKDGSYSPLPICAIAQANLPPLPGTGGSNALNIHYDTVGPTIRADSGSKYVAGSRWFDTAGNRGYVCTDNTLNAAIWKPLGMQDVRAIVVAMAILDGTSSKAVRTMPVTIDSRDLTVPKLDTLAGVLADADPANVIPNGGGGSTDPTVPSFTGPPPATPAPSRLMGEAWNNELKAGNFAQKSGLSPVVAGQVRVYQRSFVLNNQ